MPLNDGQRERIYKLVRDEPIYKPFFDYLAALKLNLKESSLNVVETQSGLNHDRSLDLMRKIAETGVADVRGGHGKSASYLVWGEDIDLREVGRSYREPLR